jgi:antitoxin VapB
MDQVAGYATISALFSLTLKREVATVETATILTHGDSQSVQLPEGFRIEGKEVFVKRVGRSVLLIPTGVDPWDVMEDSLNEFTDDFMEDRVQPEQQQREPLFD